MKATHLLSDGMHLQLICCQLHFSYDFNGSFQHFLLF